MWLRRGVNLLVLDSCREELSDVGASHPDLRRLRRFAGRRQPVRTVRGRAHHDAVAAAAPPDLVHIERVRLGIVTERAIEGAPTLVVEVLSPSTDARDRGVKQALYARYGVPFYWIVDPEARTVHLTLDPTAIWR